MINIGPKHILLIIALIILLGNRIMHKKTFFAKHGNHIRLLVFLILIGVLVMEFIKSGSYIVYIIAALGAFAIGWIIYDMNRKDDDEDNGKSEDTDEGSNNL
jgi:Kef-type K+ transport system membrane component KefB